MSLRRARILDKFKFLLMENADKITELISAEHGKTHDDTLGEVTRRFEVGEFAVGIPLRAQRLGGRVLAVVGSGIVFIFLAGRDAHDADGVTDHVGGSLSGL